MTGPWPHGKAAPTPGAALPVRAVQQVYRVLECGHHRIVLAGTSESVHLWCPDCDALSRQVPPPYTPRQEYELRTTLYRAAKERRDVIKAALTQAEEDLDDAAMAMTELEIRPGIPAHTQAPAPCSTPRLHARQRCVCVGIIWTDTAAAEGAPQ